jgi:hypothetical protein
MSGHTKEPWRVTPDGHIASKGFVPIRTPFREDAFKDGPNRSDHSDELLLANARRIVACVNACAAIPTEDLEKAAADPIAGMFGRLAGKSVSQRDHAVQALSQLLSVLDDPRRTAEQTHDALEAARSAVATITGVQP